jgi:ferredoxin-NADP reductase
VSVFLERLDGAKLEFLPGQFLTLELVVDGQRLRRAYSLSTSPLDGHAAITVKRIAGGRVSSFVNERLREGDVAHVLGPSGSFTVQPDSGATRDLVLLAGGSGITPVVSIARTVLAREPRSRVTLVYGNRRAEDVIFRDALDTLARENADRFVLEHVLEEAPTGWSGPRGRLDRGTVDARLEALRVCERAGTEFYVCGPDPMRRAVRDALAARGVTGTRVREEVFLRPELLTDADHALPDRDQTLHVRKNGLERTMIVRPGQTLLEAGLAAGMPMPFSCAMGGCAECKCELVEGSVAMEEPNCLTAEERAQGFVLACVARPRTTVRVLVGGR